LTRWEYWVASYSVAKRLNSSKQAKELDRYRDWLNEAGARGWEMIGYEAVPAGGGSFYLLFFKRPAKEPAAE
jgi:hypothetical protein